MKYYKAVLVITMMITSTLVFAQKKEVVTCEFEVSGVCEMCKNRIEEAGYIKGVKFVEWSSETGIAKVVYKYDKVTELAIHKAIAAVGHDTKLVKADSLIYNELPKCCAYNDGVNVH